MTSTPPVALVRCRRGVVEETARTVHLMPLPVEGRTGAGSALCGAQLHPQQIEAVNPGEGMPCTACLINHVIATPPPSPDTPPPLATTATMSTETMSAEISANVDPMRATTIYRSWGWPATLRGNHVWLSTEPDTVALIIPAPLAAKVTSALSIRRCPPPVLTHPATPAHRVLLCRRHRPVAPPWPRGIQRTTGSLLLPPTSTPCGPVTWVHQPRPDGLRLVREIDVLAALRAALTDQPPGDPPTTH